MNKNYVGTYGVIKKA